MGWNYRVLRHASNSKGQAGEDAWYAIHEVYYRRDDVDDSQVTSGEVGYSADPVSPAAESVDDLQRGLAQMVEALGKPVLDYVGDESSIQLKLSRHEALVLFEFASRFSDSDNVTVEHQAEARALWNLCCLLEHRLTEPFAPDYHVNLSAARDRLSREGS